MSNQDTKKQAEMLGNGIMGFDDLCTNIDMDRLIETFREQRKRDNEQAERDMNRERGNE
jgi:hypothetical protein